MMRVRVGAAAVLAAAALAGCGTGPAPEAALAPAATARATPSTVPAAPPTTAAPVELGATVLQYRRDEARGVVQVKVSNDGARPVRIAAIALDAPGFAEVEAAEPDADLAPGRRVDLPLAYGDVRCDDGGADAGRDMTVDLRVAVDGGPVEDRRLEVPPTEQIGLVAATECQRLALAEMAAVEFGATWALDESGGAPVLSGALALRRTAGAEPLALDQVGASTLFVVQPTTAASPLLRLDAPTAGAEVPVKVTAPRCEAHALADSKRAFTIPAWVAAGDGEPVATTITVDDASRAQLEDLLARSCGTGG